MTVAKLSAEMQKSIALETLVPGIWEQQGDKPRSAWVFNHNTFSAQLAVIDRTEAVHCFELNEVPDILCDTLFKAILETDGPGILRATQEHHCRWTVRFPQNNKKE